MTPSAPAQFNRSQFAEASGVNAETLRFYEKTGVLEPTRAANGYRVYDASHLKRVRLIQRTLALGFSIDALKGWLAGQGIDEALAQIAEKERQLKKLRGRLKKLASRGAEAT
jgi:MerR family transcriptional regulator, mercuric resistance operon regulatory protein